MSPPGGAAATEAPVLLDNGVGAESLQHIPRKWKRDAVRVLLDLGYRTTPNQALRLLHDWREWRDGDVREFIAAEFRDYIQRRGDLISIRSKQHVPWAVRSRG